MRTTPLICAWASLAACALLGKNEPLEPRYYTPEYAAAPSDGAPAPGELRLRLGRISARAHLRERMVVSSSAQELSFYEDRRWTERPEIYLRRALSRALFEERGLVHVISGGAPTLEVELSAFEEIEGEPHRARIEAHFMLHDEHIGRMEETVAVEELVRVSTEPDQGLAVAEALSRSLRLAVSRIADRVSERLLALSTPDPADGPGGSKRAPGLAER